MPAPRLPQLLLEQLSLLLVGCASLMLGGHAVGPQLLLLPPLLRMLSKPPTTPLLTGIHGAPRSDPVLRCFRGYLRMLITNFIVPDVPDVIDSVHAFLPLQVRECQALRTLWNYEKRVPGTILTLGDTPPEA